MNNDSQHKEKQQESNPATGWPDSGLYRALVSHYIHQDRLLWGRIQLLIALQGAGLAGGYALRSNWLSPCVMVLVALLTGVIWRLAYKDGLDRDVNLELMDNLAKDLVPSETVNKLSRTDALKLPVRMTADTPRWLNWAKGRYVIYCTMAFFVVIDLLLAALYIWCPILFPAINVQQVPG